MEDLAFVFYQQYGYQLELEKNARRTIGKSPQDDCRFPHLTASQFTLMAEDSGVSVRYGFLKRQTLQMDSINMLPENSNVIIYVQRFRPVRDQYIELPEGKVLLLGRLDNSDLQINNPLISGKHLYLRREKDRLEIEDPGSKNGTFVDNEKIASRTLQRGECFCILNMRFRFEGSRLIGENIYDSFENHIVYEEASAPAKAEELWFELNRPNEADLGMKRLEQKGIRLERFQDNFIVTYLDYAQRQDLPLYLFSEKLSAELILPRHFTYNGFDAILYPSESRKQLSLLLDQLYPDEVLSIYQSFFTNMILLDYNRDVEIRHILIRTAAIFVDIITLGTKLVYIPFSEVPGISYEMFLSAVRYEMADALDRCIAETQQVETILQDIRKILTNAALPFSAIPEELGKVKKTWQQSPYMNPAGRESLLERISSKTRAVQH